MRQVRDLVYDCAKMPRSSSSLKLVNGVSCCISCLCSYIGGSVNFAAVSSLLGLSSSGSTLAAAMTADNLAMAAYIAVIMSIPAKLPASSTIGKHGQELNGIPPAVTAESMALALATGTVACTLGNALAIRAGFASGGLAFTALVASGLVALTGLMRRFQADDSPSVSHFSGAEALGGALMMFFFATIGAAAGSLGALAGCGWLLVFIAIQLSIQLSVSVLLGRAMRIPLPIVLVAANANVGGPATAAAMAGAKGWRSLVQPAILTGALGYAVANAVGWGMGALLQQWYLLML